MADPDREDRGERPFPSTRQGWWTVGVFSLISVASVLDRGILNMIVDPVRHDLKITDVQISLLQGLAFGLFYATVGLPLGLCADRVSRRWLIVAGISVWSAATIYGGFASGFAGLFASRMLVGLGEAALSPAAISIISDLFPASRRGRPISVFLLGQGLASGLSIQLTGMILAGAAAGDFAFLFGKEPLAPWRVAFIICGMLGLPAVLLALTVREPPRRGQRAKPASDFGIGAVVNYVRRNAGIFGPLYLGFAVASLAIYGASAWLPTLLARGFGMGAEELGHSLGIISMAAGAVGALSGGYFVDRVSRSGFPAGKLLLAACICLMAIPGAFMALAPNGLTAICIASIMIAAFPLIGTAVISATQELMPNNMRGIAVSLTGFSNAVIGSTLGPLLIALATAHLFADDKSVGASVGVVASAALALGAGIFFLGYRNLRRQLANGGELKRVMVPEAIPGM